jgi:hypothetical protein
VRVVSLQQGLTSPICLGSVISVHACMSGLPLEHPTWRLGILVAHHIWLNIPQPANIAMSNDMLCVIDGIVARA